MAVGKDVIEAAREVERETGVAAAALLAVAIVETNGRAFAAVGARAEPLIRFEGHYFDWLLDEAPRRIARAAGLSHPRAGVVKNPAGQEARWRLLGRAAALDKAAAYASTSWGLGQVMGSHFAALGLASAEALAGLARGSAAGQLVLVARFLKIGGLTQLIESGDMQAFARRYNGPNFKRNCYDAKIAAAWRQAGRLLAVPAEDRPLMIGMRGAGVVALQRALSEHGLPLAADGIFGPLTEAALMRFQGREGLAASGAADRETMRRLLAAVRPAAEIPARNWP